MKRFEISYNPYSNEMHFKVAIPVDEEHILDWCELPNESVFSEYQNNKCIFENNVEKILKLINQYINTTEYLEIFFKGTVEDFEILRNSVDNCTNPSSRRITCKHVEAYLSPDVVLERIKSSYSKVEKEFDFFFNSYEPDSNGISDALIDYKDVVKPDIPICILGTKGVGKSVLINALIGQDILPSIIDGSNAISTVVRNDKEYRIEFEFLHEFYVIVFEGNNYSIKTPFTPNDVFISYILGGCEVCSCEQELLHIILKRLFSDDLVKLCGGSIGNCVSVYVPFAKTQLESDNYPFSFIETPIRLEEKKEEVIISLEETAIKQTNALPIIVVTKKELISEELLDLKKLLDELGDGFAKPNSIIAVSMSDVLTLSQMREELPDSIREGIANPCVMYVSPVAGIREPRSKNCVLTRLNPPDYNILPSHKSFQPPKPKLDKLLLASGIPSLEWELNYYAQRFSDYKKCAQGQRFLLEAVNKLIVELKVAKVQFENEFKVDNEKRKKEKTVVRSELVSRISQVQIPNLNSVFEKVSTQFKPVLDEYCKSVPDAVSSCWGRVGHRTNESDNLFKEMQYHCQTNLYDKNSPVILNAIKGELLCLTSEYMCRVKTCISDTADVIAPNVLTELNAVFDSTPQLVDVAIQPIVLISTNPINLIGSDSAIIARYSKGFIEQLKPSSIRWGHFDRQCIQEPTTEYSKQLTQWIEQQLVEIRKLLSVDNSILSKLDKRIEELKNIIEDLDKRIGNIAEVQSALLKLIPFEERP